MLPAPEALENLFRQAQDASPDSFVLYRIGRDDAGAIAALTCIYQNPAAARLSGVLQHGPDLPACRRVADTGEALRRELCCLEAGSEVWFETTVTRVDAHCLAVSSRDITASKRAAAALQQAQAQHHEMIEELRRSEQALNRAQQIAHLGSWDWHYPQSEYVCSPELFAIFGIPPGTGLLDPDSFLSYVHPEDRDRLRDAVSETKRRGGAFDLEYRVARRDGTVRYVLSQGIIHVEGGRAMRVVGTILDITDRKQAERRRDESLQWLRTVLAQSPVGLMLVYGPDGHRIEVNDHLQRLTGGLLTADGSHPGVFLTPDAAVVTHEELPSIRALRGEQLRLVEYLLRNDLGDAIPVLVSATPIRDDSGEVQGAVVAFQDITPVRELERMRAEWNTIIAHDLRQPLNTISLSTGILNREAGDAAHLRRPIDWIMRATRRLTGMIEELFDLSRLEAKQLTLSRRTIDLLALVQTSVDVMELQAAGRRFEVRTDGAVAPVSADGDRIAQVLENLLTNAVKYSFADTAVLIAVAPAPGYMTVAVTNSGPGIAADELPRLFQRFRRTDTARRSTVYGVGLGLYIARQLIEAHGGRLTAESSPGTTTTFRFVLPIS